MTAFIKSFCGCFTGPEASRGKFHVFSKRAPLASGSIGILLMIFSIGLAGMEYRVKGNVSIDDRQEMEAIFNEAEKEFLPLFKLDSNYRLNIYVCKDLQEFLRLTGVSWWNGGHFRDRTIYLQRLEVLRERGIFKQTLVHEFLHFCIRRLAGNNCPVWLNEGLVLNLTGEIRLLDCFNSSKNKQFPVGDLDKLIRGKDREKAKLAYCQAAMLVSKLLKKVGFEKVRKGLQGLKDGNSESLQGLFPVIQNR